MLVLICIPANAQHEYVDLGLSVKWATCNVGADKPEEYGDYYAWGELEPKESYTWENYRFRTRGYDEGTVRLSKYTSICYTGLYDENGISIADDKTLLEPENKSVGIWGYYWSSSVNRNETSHSASVLCFGSSYDAVKITFRNHGQSVRPVCP